MMQQGYGNEFEWNSASKTLAIANIKKNEDILLHHHIIHLQCGFF